MSVPTSQELSLLRSRPHSTKLWLSIYQPPTVLACQVNESGVSDETGLREIDYDNVTQGSYLSVESGMTMYVGSSPGEDDIGHVRVRSATATTITIAENSDISWSDDYYLTIVKYWEIWPIYPRIIQDPADEENTLWYKDYDIEYTNQNSILGTLICMGSHYACFLENGQADVYYSATGTYNLREENLAYSWWFDGADTTGSSVHTPGYMSYSNPGHYTTRLIVSGTSTGAVDTSYRHISVYNRPNEGSTVPILEWNLLSIEGSRDGGGYTARFWVREEVDEIRDGALVVLFADDIYGTTEQSIGGNSLNRQKIAFAGYIIEGSIAYNFEDSSIEFSVGSPTEIMKVSEGFAIAVNDSTDPASEAASDENIPSAWALLLEMDIRRAMYHYLKWHSTVLFTSDIEFVGTDYRIEYFDSDRESIFDAVNNLMKALVGEIVCDRQGKIWAEVSLAATDDVLSNFPTNMILDKQDWVGLPSIEERQINNLSFLEIGGVAYTGATSTPLLSSAPGNAPAYRGGIEKIQGLALSSQAQLNILAGNLFVHKNARYPRVEYRLSGNYRNFDIAPQEIVKVQMALGDTRRGIRWDSKPFAIQEMIWEYSSQDSSFSPTLIIEEIPQVLPGKTIVGSTIPIPPIPPTDNPDDDSDFDQPPIYIPPLPGLPPGTSPTARWLPINYGYRSDTGMITNDYGYIILPAGVSNTYAVSRWFSGGTPGGTATVYVHLTNGVPSNNVKMQIEIISFDVRREIPNAACDSLDVFEMIGTDISSQTSCNYQFYTQSTDQYFLLGGWDFTIPKDSHIFIRMIRDPSVGVGNITVYGFFVEFAGSVLP